MTQRFCTLALVARVEPRAAIFLEISDRSQTRSTACRHDEAQLLDHVLHPGGVWLLSLSISLASCRSLGLPPRFSPPRGTVGFEFDQL